MANVHVDGAQIHVETDCLMEGSPIRAGVRPQVGPITSEEAPCGLTRFVRCLIEITSRQQQTQPTLLDWPRSKKLKR